MVGQRLSKTPGRRGDDDDEEDDDDNDGDDEDGDKERNVIIPGKVAYMQFPNPFTTLISIISFKMFI